MQTKSFHQAKQLTWLRALLAGNEPEFRRLSPIPRSPARTAANLAEMLT
jgi:hypothetical protein